VDYLNEAAGRYFGAHGVPKRDMENQIMGMLFQRRSFFGVAKDMLKLLQGMRG
jgi:electron transfer flavoprotein-quinone oxidoreductase